MKKFFIFLSFFIFAPVALAETISFPASTGDLTAQNFQATISNPTHGSVRVFSPAGECSNSNIAVSNWPSVPEYGQIGIGSAYTFAYPDSVCDPSQRGVWNFQYHCEGLFCSGWTGNTSTTFDNEAPPPPPPPPAGLRFAGSETTATFGNDLSATAGGAVNSVWPVAMTVSGLLVAVFVIRFILTLFLEVKKRK